MPLPKLLVTAALFAANFALQMTKKIEGPRQDSLGVSVGDYGTPLAEVWGKRRIEGAPIIWAEPIREHKRRAKTKGGKYNEYTYTGTWAIALANHEIDGLTRLWLDKHLVLDLTGAGPITPFPVGSSAMGKKGTSSFRSIKLTDHIAIYLGTETQLPDERIAATEEAKHGAGAASAYRGRAYLVFKDFPLEKFGNRIPIAEPEVVRSASGTYPKETIPTLVDPPNRLWNIAFATDYSRIMWLSPFDSASFEIWDVAARTRIISGVLPTGGTLAHGPGIKEDGSFYVVGPAFGDSRLYLYSPDGRSYTEVIDFGGVGQMQLDVFVCRDANDVEHWGSTPYFNTTAFFDGAAYDPLDDEGVALVVACWFADGYGDVWAAASNGAGPDEVYFLRRVNASGRGGSDRVKVSVAAGHGASMALHYRDASVDQFIFYSGSTIYAADIESGAVNFSVTFSPDVYNTAKQFRWCPPGAPSLWLGGAEISLADLTTIRSLNISSGPWGTVEVDSSIYDPVNHALWTFPQFTNETTILYLDRIDGGETTLGDIASDVAGLCGAEDCDFSDLTQLVQGYSTGPSQGSTILEPLFDAYDADIAPHEFGLRGLRRTGVASGTTLLTERFVAGEPRYALPRRQSRGLPRALIYKFADTAADQQVNAVRADRPLEVIDARDERQLDLSTLLLSASDARALADRHFRRIWNERREASLSLTMQIAALEPGDVRNLSFDGEVLAMRCRSASFRADDTIASEWLLDHPSLATLAPGAGATFDGRRDSVILVPILSRGFVLDVPFLSDATASSLPLLVLAAAPYAAGLWPGADILREIGGEYSDEIGSIAASDGASWGYADDALADADPWIWDRGNSLTVELQNGTLLGCTEAEIDADPARNLFALENGAGWELCQFTTPTLISGTTWTLSGLKRGRRGSEVYCAGHAAGNLFLLLDHHEVAELGLSEVGTNQSAKAVTLGRTPSGAFPLDLVPFTGASLKPYAPCHLEASLDSGSGDWTLAWVRRTRVGGAWTSSSVVPLSEVTEEYAVDIYDGVDVVRTISVTAATATYSAADQTTDFGAPQTSLSWSVQQISDAVGRGFLAAA